MAGTFSSRESFSGQIYSFAFAHDAVKIKSINIGTGDSILHLPALIQDLGIILAVAGIVTLLFKKIGQPLVLGYMLAGFLVGPEVSFFPTVQEKEAINIWA